MRAAKSAGRHRAARHAGVLRPGRAAVCALGVVALALALTGCATGPTNPGGTSAAGSVRDPAVRDEQLLNRITWGASPTSAQAIAQSGEPAYLEAQLHPGPARLPPLIADQIQNMTISVTPLDQLVFQLEAQRKAADANPDPEEKKTAQQAYQQELAPGRYVGGL